MIGNDDGETVDSPVDPPLFLFQIRSMVEEGEFRPLLQRIEEEINRAHIRRADEVQGGEFVVEALEMMRKEVIDVLSTIEGGIAAAIGEAHRLTPAERIMRRAEWFSDIRLGFFLKVEPGYEAELRREFQREKNRRAEETKRNSSVKRQAEEVWRTLFERRRRENSLESPSASYREVERRAAAYETQDPDLRMELAKSWHTIKRRLEERTN